VTSHLIDELLRARAAEKQQALFYRALASEAEDAGETDTAERLNGLHADEQHHFSRISARLMELGEDPPDVPARAPKTFHAHLASWEADAGIREQSEIQRYEKLLTLDLDAATRQLLDAILSTERHHAESLGGKWTPA
jgi:rubrerythrin